jgi:hypothetical protein
MIRKISKKSLAVRITIAVLFLNASLAFAQTAPSKPSLPKLNNLKSKIIISTFKTLAKAVVASDTSKFKETLKNKISAMDESGFSDYYQDFFEHLEEYDFLVKKYNLTQNLNREEAIEIINSLDNQKIFQIIDNLPGQIIFDELNRFAKKNKEDLSNDNQVIKIINQIIGYLKNKYLGK